MTAASGNGIEYVRNVRGTTTYRAVGGRVLAITPTGRFYVSTALSAGGTHLERFEKALNRAKEQRP